MYVTQVLVTGPDNVNRWVPFAPNTILATADQLTVLLNNPSAPSKIEMSNGCTYTRDELMAIVKNMKWGFFADLNTLTETYGVYRTRPSGGTSHEMMRYEDLQDALKLRDFLIDMEWKNAVAAS